MSLSRVSPLANGSSGPKEPSSEYRLYPQRWLVLFIFSGLAFLNNLVCYTFASVQVIARDFYAPVAPIPSGHGHAHAQHGAYAGEHLNSRVSAFFITYVLFSFPSSYLVDRFGLRAGVLLGAWLQTAGCGLRTMAVNKETLYWLHVGQIVASLGQAFFVNPPPLLAETWFGPDERTMATTLSVNMNTLGIAGAYLLGPALVHSVADIPNYVQLIFFCSAVFALLATFCFPSAPATPPSFSQHFHNSSGSGTHFHISFHSIYRLFKHPGFIHTLLAFALAEATINGFSAFMNSILVPSGYSNAFIGFMAVSLIFMCMIGSAVFGYIVDKTHSYKSMLILCFIGTGLSVAFFIKASYSALLVSISVCILGTFIGPLQPLAVESAVECTYPSSASTVTAILQVSGNLASAALFPLVDLLREDRSGSMSPALWALAVVQLIMAIIYTTFNGRYLRRLHESGDTSYLIHADIIVEERIIIRPHMQHAEGHGHEHAHAHEHVHHGGQKAHAHVHGPPNGHSAAHGRAPHSSDALVSVVDDAAVPLLSRANGHGHHTTADTGKHGTAYGAVN